MTLLRVPTRQSLEGLDAGHRFAGIMQQAERVGRRPQRVQLIIQVSDDEKAWRDFAEISSERWRPTHEGGPALPTKEEGAALLREAAQMASTRYAQLVIRSVI